MKILMTFTHDIHTLWTISGIKMMRGIIVGLLASSIAACSSAPSVDDVKPIILNKLVNCPIVKPDNFKKTNGIQNPDGSYTIKYTYELVIQADGPIKSGTPYAKCDRFVEINRISSDIFSPSSGIKKGDVLSVNGSMDFIKSEKGWIEK